MDFTIRKYITLLDTLLKSGYNFITVQDYFSTRLEKFVILRHDVDDKKMNSLHFAEIQNRLGIRGTYYFRMVPKSYDPRVIKRIAALEHEIGYHYEDMDFAVKALRHSPFVVPNFPQAKSKRRLAKSKSFIEADLYDTAFQLFKEHLATLRELSPVITICMHGSPRSDYDNKALWKKYNYKELDIIGEPYIDLDFNKVLYLTDTGRRWDGQNVSIRDKVEIPSHFNHLSFRSTHQIIEAAANNQLPDKIMFTFHPQRWTNSPPAWTSEFIRQNAKNIIKRLFFVNKSRNAKS
jgi:hypothetical protein